MTKESSFLSPKKYLYQSSWNVKKCEICLFFICTQREFLLFEHSILVRTVVHPQTRILQKGDHNNDAD
jgi:hypothetical protein